ncbi:hypothetical protein DPMN_123447 [Dreissena polymorpha]|uniref:Uncharacterized protein n=1 Tax=Dreissena polymorpha TaxID=45954 RepID=A0A9D4GRC3_DREPO|nr:hypothetical protein DPMN_123447 [Dreissena polymorpha]
MTVLVTGHWSLTGLVTGHAVTGPVNRSPVIDRSGHQSLTGPVTGFRYVPQTVPVTVDVDTKVNAAAFLL